MKGLEVASPSEKQQGFFYLFSRFVKATGLLKRSNHKVWGGRRQGEQLVGNRREIVGNCFIWQHSWCSLPGWCGSVLAGYERQRQGRLITTRRSEAHDKNAACAKMVIASSSCPSGVSIPTSQHPRTKLTGVLVMILVARAALQC